MKVLRFNKQYGTVIFQLFNFKVEAYFQQDSRTDIIRKSQRTLKLVSVQQLNYIKICTRVYFLLSESFHVQSYAQYMLVINGTGFPGDSVIKSPPAAQKSQEMWVLSLGREDPLEELDLATHCSILAWEIPWTKELGGLPSMGSQRVQHDLGTENIHI